MDYRYFPDPDLLPLAIADDWIERVRQALPELPAAMRERFERQYGLPASDAQTLTASRELAAYYESLVAMVADYKVAANWVLGELAAHLNESEVSVADSPVSATQLAELIGRVLDETISSKAAKEVLDALWHRQAASADSIIEARGLKQISDLTAIEAIVDDVLAGNARSVEEFRAGKEKAFNALVGQAMKASRGRANPQQVNEVLRRKLEKAGSAS
jgi:aspartyl-tRNA(Asn)/glutamyl-tRNA(Gln) amidotransferase subunit B